MKVRGRRRCRACGRRWSYYETGSVECPGCGSLESVGLDDERRLHTDAPVELDLSSARAGIDERPLRDVAADAADAAREYVLARGFVHGGELRALDDVVLAAAELRHAADAIRRALDPTEAAERYFLALLSGAEDGERPEGVPDGMRSARGLAAAAVVDAYREDVARWLDEHPDPDARRALGRVRDRVARIEALDGEVAPAEADRIVAAARDLGTYLREGDARALARVDDRLERSG